MSEPTETREITPVDNHLVAAVAAAIGTTHVVGKWFDEHDRRIVAKVVLASEEMAAVRRCLLAYAENHMPDYWNADSPNTIRQWLRDGNRALPESVVDWVMPGMCDTCVGTGSVLRDDGRGGLINDSCPDCTKAAE